MSVQSSQPLSYEDEEAAPVTSRITFHDTVVPRGDELTRGRGTSASRRRSVSRDSIRSTEDRVRAISPESGVQIQFRTLSIQVSEAKAIEEPSLSIENADDREYFSKLKFHKLDSDEVCHQLHVASNIGLSNDIVANRIKRDGANKIPKTPTNYFKKIFWYIFGGFCSVLWIGVIIFFLCWQPLSHPPSIQNLATGIVVIVVIILQAGFSAFQDWSTRHVMNSILDLLPAEATVLREGQVIRVLASELVQGDIVQISIGNKVPADLRLISHSGDIRFDRSILTGESDEIEGVTACTDENFLESRNIALMGTMVTNGNGTGVVILTGARSVMGRIAKATTSVKEVPTLIHLEIQRFVRIIVMLTVFLALLILLAWVGWLRVKHYSYMNVVAMLNDVMGCVVAFIPEGLPIGVALTLLMIASRMKAVNILPKGLTTVETLGCVNVICSDKTGTLTENKMVVTTIAFVDEQLENVDDAYKSLVGDQPKECMVQLHRAAVLCNDAIFDPTTLQLPVGDRKILGNATDGAILRFAERAKRGDELKAQQQRIFEIPFNSKNKWMLAMYPESHSLGSKDSSSSYSVFVKGAPDVLIPKCSAFWSGKTDSIQPLNFAARAEFSALQDRLSNNAERVLVLCYRKYQPTHVPGTNDFSDEVQNYAVQDLTIVGILGITDPPRPEAADTVAACRRAGSRFFMVTGDYPLTAAAIARNIGIFSGTSPPDGFDDIHRVVSGNQKKSVEATVEELSYRSLVLDGNSIAKLSHEDWDIVCKYEEIVFARTTPDQKLRIVNELKFRDNVVAVTGDGVNDAPALRAANVGVALVSGSDVAIEAADLVLMDQFDSIVDAIRLGRLVFQNLQKVIAYLLPAGSWSEIWPVILNVFFGVPLPLSSFLMIIICVFTDLFCSLSLIMEKEEFDLLSIPPRNHKRDHLINLKIYVQAYLFMGVMETVCAHSMFFLYMWKYAKIPVSSLFLAFEKYSDGYYGYTQDELTHFNQVGQCVYFVTLVILQWGNILSVRNKRLSILQADPFRRKRRNPWLIASLLISLCIAVFVTETPPINKVFGTAPIPIEFWLYPLPLALGILCMDELRKVLVRTWPTGPIARISW